MAKRFRKRFRGRRKFKRSRRSGGMFKVAKKAAKFVLRKEQELKWTQYQDILPFNPLAGNTQQSTIVTPDVLQGVGYNMRIGNEIRVKSLKVHWSIQGASWSESTNDTSWYRVLVIRSRMFGDAADMLSKLNSQYTSVTGPSGLQQWPDYNYCNVYYDSGVKALSRNHFHRNEAPIRLKQGKLHYEDDLNSSIHSHNYYLYVIGYCPTIGFSLHYNVYMSFTDS